MTGVAPRAFVTGASGLVGRALTEALPDVLVSSRRAAAGADGASRRVVWDPVAGPPPLTELGGVRQVFHLAGEPVAAGRWTRARKSRIRESRVLGTRHLVDGLARLSEPPEVLICASAVGYYGDRGDELLDERSDAGHDFLAQVCTAWEAEALRAEDLGVRVVCARLGVVLGAQGGALSRMLPAFRAGAGGRLGDGRQWMPWVALEDVVGLLLHAARGAEIRGPMNVVAPSPVQNRDFTAALGATLGRPAVLPLPRLALRAAFGELATVLLSSQRVDPGVARSTGYDFAHADLDGALRAALAPPAAT